MKLSIEYNKFLTFFFLFRIAMRVGNCCSVWGKTLENLDYNTRLNYKSTLDNNSEIDLDNQIDTIIFRDNRPYILDISSPE